MPKFKVSMQERAFYSVVVEADNEDDAEAAAKEAFVQGDYSTDGFDDRIITDVEEITP